ncbi:hypothetical protein DL93DRAFT_2146926 [Clavulina sp. PMI_390]|nr:hypothetical protein DL93DRAFT_2146926 [Clavulina sp. PMI_390]
MHVENGWYCVKLPGPEQLRQNITWEAAREHEANFFRNPPWANQLTLRDRYGVPSLTQQLSFLLSELIAEKQVTQIERILAETQDRFNRLPSPPSSDPVQEVTGLIWKFQRQVDREIEGTADRGGLIQKINMLGDSFRHDIRASAPIFVPFRVDQEYSSNPTLVRSHDLSNVSDQAPRIFRAISRELPDNVPFTVQRELIQAFLEFWSSSIGSFITRADETVNKHFMNLSRAHFSGYPALHRKVNFTLKDRRSTLTKNARQYIGWLYEMEKQSTFTLNLHYIRDYKQKFLVLYRSYRLQYLDEGDLVRRWTPVPPHAREARERKRKLLLDRVISGDATATHDLLPLLPTDSSNVAIEIMADVRAYWQVTFKRFVDYVSLAIDMEFVRGFGKDLGVTLVHDLGISGPKAKELYAAYVAEPREIAAERENLRHQLDRLETAQSMIEEWQQEAGAPM